MPARAAPRSCRWSARPDPANVRRTGCPPRLWRRFGTEATQLLGDPGLLRPLVPGLPVLRIEVRAAVEREGALDVDDVLDRRTRLGLVPDWREAAAGPAAELLG